LECKSPQNTGKQLPIKEIAFIRFCVFVGRKPRQPLSILLDGIALANEKELYTITPLR
jgi:hypothetical protein